MQQPEGGSHFHLRTGLLGSTRSGLCLESECGFTRQMGVRHSWEREKARMLVVPKVLDVDHGVRLGEATKCQVKIDGVADHQRPCGFCPGAGWTLKTGEVLLAFRKLAQQNEQLSRALKRAHRAISLQSSLEARVKAFVKACVLVLGDEMRPSPAHGSGDEPAKMEIRDWLWEQSKRYR